MAHVFVISLMRMVRGLDVLTLRLKNRVDFCYFKEYLLMFSLRLSKCLYQVDTFIIARRNLLLEVRINTFCQWESSYDIS